jgi:6-pyruvoyltetrahydropterin/6-carboxytetrahydropterin synthase
MRFEVGVVAQFTAEHHLVGDFGPASSPHIHDYRVEAAAASSQLQADGTSLDITIVQRALGGAIADLAGRDLNTIPALAEPNPTAEVVARYLFERMARDVAGLVSVRVWESPEAYAAYASDTART